VSAAGLPPDLRDVIFDLEMTKELLPGVEGTLGSMEVEPMRIEVVGDGRLTKSCFVLSCFFFVNVGV
jgi:hypothetical protein